MQQTVQREGAGDASGTPRIAMNAELRERAQELLSVLEAHPEDQAASQVRAALSGDDARLEAFLRSNELWGGAGSVADQAGIPRGGGRPERRAAIERALIALGRAQIRAGIVNVRTAMWTEVFEKWHRSDDATERRR